MLYLITKNVLTTILILGGILGPFILYVNTSMKRKEILNIIKTKNRIYFNLSDDELFSIKISEDEPLPDVLINAILKEIGTIKEMVDRVDFVNFRDDRLHKELNELIQKN
jgi:hypothetical protein